MKTIWKQSVLTLLILTIICVAFGCSSTESDQVIGTAAVAVPNSEDNPPPPVSQEGEISKDQGQFWTSNVYVVSEDGSFANSENIAFGVNHATGHIKAYPSDEPGPMAKHVRAVSGSVYGTEYTYSGDYEEGELRSENVVATSEDTYIDNGDGAVTDTSTGLMWIADDQADAMEWEEALDYAENLEFAGYDDWKLPDVKELQSLLDYSGVYPAINDDYFTCKDNTDVNENYYYWTSTSAYFSKSDPTYYYAWYVAFGFAIGNDGEDSHGAGGVRFSPKYSESEAFLEGGDNMLNNVRAVRIDERYYDAADSKVVTTGQSFSYDGDGIVIDPEEGDSFYGQDADYISLKFSFTNNGDGTITDNNTGLIWQEIPVDDHMSIQEAQEYVDNLELAGITDWRLPTAEELFSISDFSTGWPYLNQNYFGFPAASDFNPPEGGGPQG